MKTHDKLISISVFSIFTINTECQIIHKIEHVTIIYIHIYAHTHTHTNLLLNGIVRLPHPQRRENPQSGDSQGLYNI